MLGHVYINRDTFENEAFWPSFHTERVFLLELFEDTLQSGYI